MSPTVYTIYYKLYPILNTNRYVKKKNNSFNIPIMKSLSRFVKKVDIYGFFNFLDL